jgi:hypothetical protein
MSRRQRWFWATVCGAMIAAGIFVGAGWSLTRRGLAGRSGTLHLPGLSAPVSVIRDQAGIPHIHAQNRRDLARALGYVQAQDRLWQMEYNRRIGHGTLSEMFGDATIKQDRYLRTIGLGRAAQQDYAAMSDEEKHEWDRQPRETSRSYELFCVYRNLGAERSLAKARGSAEGIPSVARLKVLSRKWNWVERGSGTVASCSWWAWPWGPIWWLAL